MRVDRHILGRFFSITLGAGAYIQLLHRLTLTVLYSINIDNYALNYGDVCGFEEMVFNASPQNKSIISLNCISE